MIHLDTSFLIRAFVPATRENRKLRRWLTTSESVALSAVAWAEFLCGPVTPVVVEDVAEAVGEPEPFNGTHAAVAIQANARLATSNPADFRPFLSHGLVLMT